MRLKTFTFLNLNNVRKITSYLHYLLFVTCIICVNPIFISGGPTILHHSSLSASSGNKMELSRIKMVQESNVNYFSPNNLADSLALVDLYNATDGVNWTNNIGWLSDPDIANWYGVTCDGGGRVIGLNLPYNNLTGTIPTSIGNITLLENINLSENHLSGTIPSTFSNLIHLQYIGLATNQLNGAIPGYLNTFTGLAALYLANNQFTGSIPNNLGGLSLLSSIWLAGNQLSGVIPSNIGDITTLTFLGIGYNNLSGTIPSNLGNLTQLT